MLLKKREALQLFEKLRMRKSGIWEPILWGLPTGLLFSTSYPPFPAWAVFFSFAPLWLYWSQAKSLRNVFLSGFVAQFLFNMIGFNWIAHTATEYGHLPRVVSILVLLAFCSFANLNLAIAGILVKWIQSKRKFSQTRFFVLLAFMTSLCDWLYPMIFPWNTGYPLYFSHFKSAQLAEFIGFHLLGTLVYLANVPFASAFEKFPRKGWTTPIYFFLGGLFLTEVVGQVVEGRLAQDDSHIKALLIQPNIGNFDKFFAERGYGYQEPIVQQLFKQTEAALQQSEKPDVIIWPETAYPASLDPYFASQFYNHLLTIFVDKNNVPLITGGYSGDPGQAQKDYNAVFAISPRSPLKNGYRKYLLLAFGEYFPGAQYLPFLKKLVPEISDFGRGAGPVQYEVAGCRFIPLICYEGLDTDYVRRSLQTGGQIFVNVTNDSWFGQVFEPRQHLVMTAARTIEYRRPIIRATNTGISTVVNRKGEILLNSPQNIEWSRVVDVPYKKEVSDTFYTLIEPWLTVILVALNLLTLFIPRKA